MYTPEEIRNIEFTRSRGYKTSEVDPFIDQCADTVEALMKENAELTKKLEVLADKLVEYRNEEDSIRTALLSAQRLGDTVVREANHKAGLILEDANIKAEKIAEVARRNIQEEEAELARIKQEVTAFKSRLLTMYKEHLSLIDVLPEEEADSPAAEPSAVPAAPVAEEVPAAEEAVPEPDPSPVIQEERVTAWEAAAASAAPSFSLNIPPLEEEEVQVVPVVPQEMPAVQGTASRPNPRFADLKFGAEYDIAEDAEEKGFFRRRK